MTEYPAKWGEDLIGPKMTRSHSLGGGDKDANKIGGVGESLIKESIPKNAGQR